MHITTLLYVRLNAINLNSCRSGCRCTIITMITYTERRYAKHKYVVVDYIYIYDTIPMI